MKRNHLLALLLSILLTTPMESPAADPADLEPLVDRNPRISTLGFSFVPPPGNGWSEEFSGQTLRYLKKMNPSEGTLFCVARDFHTQQMFPSPDALKELISDKRNPKTIPDRFAKSKASYSLEPGIAPLCVRYQEQYEDRGAKDLNGRPFLVVINNGLICLHPDYPTNAIDILFSYRYPPDNRNDGLISEGEAFINSLKVIRPTHAEAPTETSEKPDFKQSLDLAKKLLAENRIQEAVEAARPVYDLAEEESLISEAEVILRRDGAFVPTPAGAAAVERAVQIVIVPLGKPSLTVLRELKAGLTEKMGMNFVIHPTRQEIGPHDRTYATVYASDVFNGMRQQLGEINFAPVKDALGFGDQPLDSPEDQLQFIDALLASSGTAGRDQREQFAAILAQSGKIKQYDTQRLIKQLIQGFRIYGKAAIKGVLFVTDQDLYEKDGRFLFGAAWPGYGIISYRRFTAAFNNEAPNRPRLIARTLKQALSSANFIFDIPRCNDPQCARAFSPSVKEQDRKSTDLCAVCKERLDLYVKKATRTYKDKPAWGEALRVTAQVYGDMNNLAEALSYIEEALKVWREIGDKRGEALTLLLAAEMCQGQKRFDQALPYEEAALKINREIGDAGWVNRGLMRLGIDLWKLGHNARALACFEEAQDRFQASREGLPMAEAAMHVGLVSWNTGDYAKAISAYEQALVTFRALGSRFNEAALLANSGLVYWNMGEYDKALKRYEESLKVARASGASHAEGYALMEMGSVHKSLGQYGKALDYLQQSLRLYREKGFHTGEIEIHIGEVYLDQGANLDQAREIFTRLNSPIDLGRYYLLIGDYPKALAEFPRSLKDEEVKETPNTNYLLAGYIGMGLSHEGLKDFGNAKSYFRKAIAVIEKMLAKFDGLGQENYLGTKVVGFPMVEPYRGMIRILVREGGTKHIEEARSYANRAKSENLTNVLTSQKLPGKPAKDKALIEQGR
jgi:tetratricopeptide (TPR) repeat protein